MKENECQRCGKTCFPDKRAAVSFCNLNKKRVILKPYPCGKFWHVSKRKDFEVIPRCDLNKPLFHYQQFRKYLA